MMKPETKKLIILFFVLVLIKFLFSLIAKPSVFSDNFFYIKQAWSLYFQHTLLILNKTPSQYPPFYASILAGSYLFSKNFRINYLLIKLFNSLLINLSIFPLYLIARDFLDKKKSVLYSTLVLLIPSQFIFPWFIMSENLFFPLVTFYIYFLYKSLTKERWYYFVASGFILGLAILTKMLAIALLPVPFFAIFFKRTKLKYLLIHYFLVFMTAAPYFIFNYVFFSGLSGGYSSDSGNLILNLIQNQFVLLNWLINYSGYIILATGILTLPLILSSLGNETDKTFNFKVLALIILLSTFFLIAISANHSSLPNKKTFFPFVFRTGRPLGRYIVAVVPSLILIGLISWKRKFFSVSSLKIFSWISSSVLAVSAQLTLSPLFLANNNDLTFLGLLKEVFNKILSYPLFSNFNYSIPAYLLLTVLLFITPLVIFKYRKYFFNLIFFFIILNLILAISVQTWYTLSYLSSNDQTKLGFWINDNLDKDKLIYYDCNQDVVKTLRDINQKFCFKSSLPVSILSILNNNPISFNETSADCMVTTEENYKRELKKSFGKFKLYC